MNSELILERIAKLRREMRKENVSGYIISTTDEYLNEYAPECYKRLEYITGFSGSNGLAVILESKVLFFTDGRYTQQAATQLATKEFEIFNLREIANFSWSKHIKPSRANKELIVGFDPKIFTKRTIDLLSPLNPQPVEKNLIDKIWQDRPSKPNSKIYDYSTKYCGIDYQNKISEVRSFLDKKNYSALFISSPDSVCWLYNLRAHDIEFTPLLLSYALITKEKSYLFIEQDRINNDLKDIRPDIEICDIDRINEYINIVEGTVAYDANTCSYNYTQIMNQRSQKNPSVTINDPVTSWKAVKNDTELEYIQKGHIADAVAVCEFLAAIDNTDPTDLKRLTEYDLGLMLTQYRQKQQDYVMDSFPAICGYKDNGAVIHYRAAKDTAKYISGSGLLLIDSGGHYHGATTDITRTIAMGEVQAEYKKYYTAVLKGHLQLAMIKFPSKSNVTGAHLDVLARQYLWSMELDYEHGTGHGVGAFLEVHEGPHSISLAGNKATLKPGMVMSNEPGYYKAGEFGIRIENMMYAKYARKKHTTNAEENSFIEFKMLTLVPYCRRLINLHELSHEETAYLIELYKRINQEISPMLSSKAQKWLQEEINNVNLG